MGEKSLVGKKWVRKVWLGKMVEKSLVEKKWVRKVWLGKEFWFRVGRLVDGGWGSTTPPLCPDISGQWRSREDALYTGHPLILNF